MNKQRKILIVDDDEGVRGFIKSYFEGLHYAVDAAENGEEALKQFKQNDYDLIISDMLMPKMLGVTLLEKIKAIKPEQKMILMTGVQEESLKARCQALGCDMYLTKPVHVKELAQKVAACFQDV